MDYAAIILVCPLCSNKVGASFIGKKCPNPECLYQFGKRALNQQHSLENDKRVLRVFKKMHTDSTLKKSQLKKEFKLNDEDISRLKSDERYGEPRYYRADVAAYLLQKKKEPTQIKLL